MTGTDVAVRVEPQSLTVLSNEQLNYISRTDFVARDLRGNLPAILACVATGRALGIPDMTSLRSIHVIDGRATFSAELMVFLVRRRGHSIVGEVAEGSATAVGRRVDNGDEMKSTWTLAMAERAGLLGKSNWKKYPESMLWARAVSQLARMLFADCFAGSTYTVEELGEEHTDSVGEPAVTNSSDERAASEPQEEGPRSPTPADGGSDEEAPGMGARTPEPTTTVGEDDGLFPPVDAPASKVLGKDAGEEVPTLGADTSESDAATSASSSPAVISDAQRRRLRAIQNAAGVTDEALKAMVDAIAGVASSKLIPVSKYEALVAAVEAAGGGSQFEIPASARVQS